MGDFLLVGRFFFFPFAVIRKVKICSSLHKFFQMLNSVNIFSHSLETWISTNYFSREQAAFRRIHEGIGQFLK